MEPYGGGKDLCIDTAWEEDGDPLYSLDNSEKDNQKKGEQREDDAPSSRGITKTSKRSNIMMKASMRGNKKRHEQDAEGDEKRTASR